MGSAMDQVAISTEEEENAGEGGRGVLIIGFGEGRGLVVELRLISRRCWARARSIIVVVRLLLNILMDVGGEDSWAVEFEGEVDACGVKWKL